MIRSLIALLFMWIIASPPQLFAKDVLQTFSAPHINGVRLDWCRQWGRQCGAPAAQLFCRQKGFTKAARFLIDQNLGSRGVATIVFGDGRLCRAPNCSGFRAITCSKPGPVQAAPSQDTRKPATGQMVPLPQRPGGPGMKVTALGPNSTRFTYPSIRNVRVDWCRHWRSSCGRPAANLFCREMGFDRANRFSRDRGTGRRGIPTLVFGDGRICKGRRCQGFRRIVCVRSPGQDRQVAQPGGSTNSGTRLKPEPDAVRVRPEVVHKPVPIPRPRPQRTKPSGTTRSSEIDIRPMVSFTRFRPPAPNIAAENWVHVLNTINVYPAGASLFKCASGDCSLATTADFEVDPAAQVQTVQLNFNTLKVPYATGARWQISYVPFPAFANAIDTDRNPPNLLKSGTVATQQGWFSFDLKELFARLPAGASQAVFHVRVLPVAFGDGERIVGQPSNTIRVLYGAKLPPQEPFTFYAKEEVPASRPQLRLVGLKFDPYRNETRWPPGCKTWEEKYGKKKSFLKRVGGFFSGAWNWTGKAYQWVKNRAVDLASALTLKLIPDNVLEFALNSALVSAGIPPDIPNLAQLMNDGVDGLAREVAKNAVQQIPAADLASNVGNLAADIAIDVARDMAEDELRERLEKEIEQRSRQVLLQAAGELEKQLKSSGKKALCKPTDFHPVFHVTVKNTGSRPLQNVQVSAHAAPVYHGKTWKQDLAPGEQLTLVAVASPQLPSGPYSHSLLRPPDREKEDLQRWWNEIIFKKQTSITVTFPGALKCLGGDSRSRFCDQDTIVAHASPPQLVTRPYEFIP